MTKICINRPSTPNQIFTEEEERKVLEMLGDPREVAENLIKFRRDLMSMDRQLRKLVVKYPDRWVVFVDGTLVGYGKDLKKLYKRLTKRGIDLSRATPKFLTTKGCWKLLRVA